MSARIARPTSCIIFVRASPSAWSCRTSARLGPRGAGEGARTAAAPPSAIDQRGRYTRV